VGPLALHLAQRTAVSSHAWSLNSGRYSVQLRRPRQRGQGLVAPVSRKPRCLAPHKQVAVQRPFPHYFTVMHSIVASDKVHVPAGSSLVHHKGSRFSSQTRTHGKITWRDAILEYSPIDVVVIFSLRPHSLFSYLPAALVSASAQFYWSLLS
jgi:hypothetical protein